MNTILFDIETDGLNPTKIHCMSVQKNGGEIFSITNGIKEFLDKHKDYYLIGHDIHRYDIPVIERLLSVKITNKLIDTLALSWYLFPEKGRHGLEQWGEVLGVKKPVIEDWNNLHINEYVYRCESDVKITSLLWEKQLNKLLSLYGTQEKAMSLVRYLSFKMECASEQKRSRWKLDVDKTKEAYDSLIKEKDGKIEELRKAMPKVPSTTKKTRPKKPYKADGALSSVGEKWFATLKEQGLPEDYDGVVKVVSKYKEPNPASSKQIKDWLFSLGWKPETYKFVTDKQAGSVKQIPQINLERGGGICQSIKKLYDKEPALKTLEGLSVISHRATILKGFLRDVDDEGYVRAEVQGLTNTLRFKHSVCVNLPGIDTPYGKVIRGVLVAPEGYELCGSDMCSLEDTTKQHYMFQLDPNYVREMQVPDWDSHLDLAMFAGAITKEEVEAHKDGTKPQKELRKIYKQVNYACVYGAGGATISRATGLSKRESDKLVKAYWKRNWAVKEIPKSIEVKRLDDGSMWLLNPVSKFWYSLRAEKDIFSTLNQGTGVYCFDTWLAFIRSKRPQLTAQFHDEIILTVKKGNRERCKKLLKWAIKKTNEKIKLNTILDIDVQFGDNYSEIH